MGQKFTYNTSILKVKWMGQMQVNLQLTSWESCDHDLKLWTGSVSYHASCRQLALSKSFRTGRLERGLQMVQLSATRCSCIAILWVGLVSFAAITLCVAFSTSVYCSLSTQSGNFWIRRRNPNGALVLLTWNFVGWSLLRHSTKFHWKVALNLCLKRTNLSTVESTQLYVCQEIEFKVTRLARSYFMCVYWYGNRLHLLF
jgi:hypothetical protein